MLQLINVGNKSLLDYGTIASRGLMEEIRRLAAQLEGKRVLHLSATAFGGGVAEILYALVPLMRDAGLEAEWRIIRGADEFFAATKTIHNALQGSPQGLTPEQEQVYRRYNEENAQDLEDDYDFVIVHDPQPAFMIERFPTSPARWIWRCHIDLSTPNQSVLDFLLPALGRYDAGIFHMNEYVPAVPGLPPSYIYILSNLNNIGGVEVNAFQVHSHAVIQKSIKEGFGLTVTEGLWKTRPTVAGRVGGIVRQIQDGETGWLVDSSAQCADACIEILRDPAEARLRALRSLSSERPNRARGLPFA